MHFLAIRNSSEILAARTTGIYQTILRESDSIKEGNFRALRAKDLARMFQLYDEIFFAGWLAETVRSRPSTKLTFRLSPTMTRAGGKTIHRRSRLRFGTKSDHYEIAIATRMLFMNFRQSDRPVTVSGLPCADRLQAMQRIMEHEILHLLEILAWGKSSCSASRFKMLAKNIFGHLDTKHNLITPQENAAIEHSIKIGSAVEFEFDGKRMAGIVNRIHRRATVLVEAKNGMRYSNGRKYHKYYIPLPALRASNA